ncbi:hypothetical protein CYY_005883 [Polysphondylium violaceum]|uniref:2'-5' RNA ligase family protein n=1 Tax=Polysphondylium violaceum TaxID=133409 RepID=A0A8J4V6G2_9MYCE|nr:hypothetical protein CYY_005883 [Polysphondylium violaceum]
MSAQQQQLDPTKDFKSAIVLAPPEDLLTQVQSIRKLYDKAYIRWMPHINLIFPYVKLPYFDANLEKIQKVIESFPSFKIVFKELSYFKHGGNFVIWAKPETPDNPDILVQIQSALENALPGFNELSKKSENGFQPHMTLGQFNGQKHAMEQLKNIQSTFDPIEYEVTELYAIHRPADVPFTIRNVFKLTKKLD